MIWSRAGVHVGVGCNRVCNFLFLFPKSCVCLPDVGKAWRSDLCLMDCFVSNEDIKKAGGGNGCAGGVWPLSREQVFWNGPR